MKIRFLSLCIFLFFCQSALALEYIRFVHNGTERNEEGEILAEDRRGLDFLARDGQAFHITWDNLITRRSDDTPFVPYTKPELLEKLWQEFPPNEGFHFLDTPAYGPFIVVYTTSRDFANWYARLLQRLYEQYNAHWKRRGVELETPEFPLVAVVLSNKERFRQYARQDGVNILEEQCAYYHKLTNRIVVYDISGMQTFREGDRRRMGTMPFLMQPEAAGNIRTVVHEAVHQVGFNTGMHPRFVDSPIWIYEGLAVFHEVPDQRNRDLGWSLGPYVNPSRLLHLRRYLLRLQSAPTVQRPIQAMIMDDRLLSNSATALDNYALAWGLFYYLERTRSQELAAYLQLLQGKTVASEDSPEIRIADFESCFGDDWDRLYREFGDYIRRL
ncbi:MAG: DUF1570 domain-containing protein [Planctomycetaceae bacterium]|nr:DUF1570 domain-containing protein [Planctomycetaceae bacterium]